MKKFAINIIAVTTSLVVMNVLSTTAAANASELKGNHRIDSFYDAKKLLMKHVYSSTESAKTLYCDMPFNYKKVIAVPRSVTTPSYANILNQVHFEHVVAISNIGRTYTEWRNGHPGCLNAKGEQYKGRACAGKVNAEYRLVEADLYNLFPASGAVNMLRSNYDYALLPSSVNSINFGSCAMKIANRKAEPPEKSRGRIARASLYMADSYSKYRISRQQMKLFNAWDKMHPVTEQECLIAKKIEKIQGNENVFIKEPCQAKKWY
jgi:deoxyribonuclease I